MKSVSRRRLVWMIQIAVEDDDMICGRQRLENDVVNCVLNRSLYLCEKIVLKPEFQYTNRIFLSASSFMEVVLFYFCMLNRFRV